ncbi:MAG: hypothetical protein A2142_00560 [candidate division Zixibacteria bacterium RBG_16_48_11]|nr:MAG: hypothetical protein A2142_00560 [candidate division Zixibacteria bacterium RBG_16_48_11]
MQKLDYTVETKKIFDQAVADVESKTQEKGFRVLHTHDVQATLAEKGFQRGPLKIVEVCNSKYASQVLEKDIKIALMLPCPISVYTQNGKTYISALRPKVMKDFYPKAQIDQIAEQVDRIIVSIVDEAK